MEYKSEEEFLKNYDSSCFEKLSCTTDIALFSVSNEIDTNYRKLSHKFYSVLLVKRKNYPFKDKWCLPGGFIRIDEDLEDAPKRILKEETNIDDVYLEQLYTFGDVNRDPRMRIISTSYIGSIDKNNLNIKLNENTSWFKIDFEESDDKITINFDNDIDRFSVALKKILKEKTTNKYKYEVIQNDYLAFDHSIVIGTGIVRLKNKINYTDIVFNMMPEYFTLGELQQVYEVILGKKLLDPAFRRIISSKVIKTDKMVTGRGHRPSYLFKYKEKS